MPPQNTDLTPTGGDKAKATAPNGNGTAMTDDGGGGGGGHGHFNNNIVAKLNDLKADDKDEKWMEMGAPTTASVVVPPDGGWGWVVMMASFCCNVIVDGIVFSAGMFLNSIASEFNATKAEVALVSSLLSGFYLIAGPFVSAAANRWGFRPVTIVGALIASTGFALSRWATSVVYLYFTYGIIGGIGFCLIYMPSVITVGYYFEKWRALATGISLCGSGVGTFIFAPFSTMLITELGWRDALLTQAGIILLCGIFGCAFRPIQPIQVTVSGEQPEKEKMLRPEIIKSIPESRLAYSVPNSVHNTWIGAVSNTQYPTAAEIFRGSGHNLDRRPSNSALPQPRKMEQINAKPKKSSGQSTPEEAPQQLPLLQHHELKTVGEAEEENENGTLLLDDTIKPIPMTRRRHTVSEREPEKRPATTTNKASADHPRPMYRDDIFFSGSMTRVPQYQSQSSIAYHMSVTRLPTQHDVQEDVESKCKICPEAVRRTLATMLDVSLIKSPTFMLLATSGFFTMMGFFVPFLYLSPRAQDGGVETHSADFIVSAIGISNTVARILCGFLSSFESISALHLNNVAITVGGLATIFSGYNLEPWFQYTYAGIFGVAIACFSALRSILVVDLMGLEKLTNAFGILMMFQGLAAAIGAPIAGIFMDYTGNYDAAFLLSGTLFTFSAILCYPLTYVKRWETRRENRKGIAKSFA